MSDSTTHYADTICIDEHGRTACGTEQWLLDNRHIAGTHPLTPNNGLEVIMCGEEAFKRIAQDIEDARHSIDLTCWGFDPGMELVRSRGSWPRGKTYGSLLQEAAGRGVQVRLLVWYEAGLAAKQQNNMPGFTGDQRAGYLVDKPRTTRDALANQGMAKQPPAFGAHDPRTPEQQRNDYCVTWWREVLAPSQGEPDKRSRIEVRMRRGNKEAVLRNLEDEADKPSSEAGDYGGLANEKALIEDHATHHQKTILIDYAGDGGEKAVGYVMGLNSITDYWDTAEHLFDTPLREVDWARKTATAKALPEEHPISRDPYQDYVCRIAGPALRGVHKNFVDAWKRAGGAARADDADTLPPRLAQADDIPWRVQIVRTQPEEGDKTVKETYFHAVGFARNYLYIENQYFFYESWVRHLKEKRKKFMEGLQGKGKDPKQSKMLHVFAVIPWPEDDGMVPRTYDTVKSLGEAESFPAQNVAMQSSAKAREAWGKAAANPAIRPYLTPLPHDPIGDSAARVQAPRKNHATGELQGLGLKVVIGRLITFNHGRSLPKPELNYRQVYIHSKLMLIDDSFFTLGSANLNQRSMAADSEINIATDDHDQAMALRQKVWRLHAGGSKNSAGSDASPQAIADAFADWKAVMEDNKRKMGEPSPPLPIVGYLVKFEDSREIHFRHG